ncbi:WD-40 repeat-containing protein [Suillus ampliporus]|nr:WD-40 repeat-containing protein [Suillus ampliporus]
MALPAPLPTHLLRSHSSEVSALLISTDNERIYSGDAAGQVVVTSTRSLRPLASWKAHTDSLLGESASIRQGPATLSDLSTPAICYSMDVNALNYCRFSLLFPAGANEREGLLAVPNLVESTLADVWSLTLRQRLYAAISNPLDTSATAFSDGRSGGKSGIIMSIHPFYAASSAPSTSARELRLLCAYEDGGVVLRKRTAPENEQTVEGRGWEVLWKSKLHVESVMAMTVSLDCTFALTVSADHLVGRYDLMAGKSSEFTPTGIASKTKYPGNGAIAIHGDGRVYAIGGWDGKVRLYSTKTFKLLGPLVHHKQACQVVIFASVICPPFGDAPLQRDSRDDDSSGDEDDVSVEEKRARARWLIAGGTDAKVSIWALVDFEKTSSWVAPKLMAKRECVENHCMLRRVRSTDEGDGEEMIDAQMLKQTENIIQVPRTADLEISL